MLWLALYGFDYISGWQLISLWFFGFILQIGIEMDQERRAAEAKKAAYLLAL